MLHADGVRSRTRQLFSQYDPSFSFSVTPNPEGYVSYSGLPVPGAHQVCPTLQLSCLTPAACLRDTGAMGAACGGRVWAQRRIYTRCTLLS